MGADAESAPFGAVRDFDQLHEAATSAEHRVARPDLENDELMILGPEITISSLRSSPGVVKYRSACDRVVNRLKETVFLREIEPSELHPNLWSRDIYLRPPPHSYNDAHQ